MTMMMEPPGILFPLFLDFRALRQYHRYSWGTDDINRGPSGRTRMDFFGEHFESAEWHYCTRMSA